MRIGQLNRRVRFERKGTGSTNAFGEVVGFQSTIDEHRQAWEAG